VGVGERTCGGRVGRTGDAAVVLGDVGGGGAPVLQRRGTDGRAR
jgi:hypothetical protein